MFRLLKVRGHSLYPEYRDGDYVLTARVPFPSGKIKSGNVIVFRQPVHGLLVKRVQKVLNNGTAFEVRGTQFDSTDSRNFGPVPLAKVEGKVIWHFRQD